MLSKPTTSRKITKKSRLDVCNVCRQVLNATDVAQHQTNHVLENDFPLLSNGLSNENQSWTKKWQKVIMNTYSNNIIIINDYNNSSSSDYSNVNVDNNNCYSNLLSNQFTYVYN